MNQEEEDQEFQEEEEKGLNEELREKLRVHFEPLGIVAYSACCRWGCTGAYDEDNREFQVRKDPGIFFIRLHLDGMNYRPDPSEAHAHYENFQYLLDHWDQECEHIDNFCRILGLPDEAPSTYTLTYLALALQCPVPILAAISANWPKAYQVVKPENQNRTVQIHFRQPLALEMPN